MDFDAFPTELLEGVLLLLDEQTLLLAQRVSRRWCHCIQNSIAIQQALFYRPVEANPWGGIPITRQNPFLVAKFSYWFPTDNLESCRTFFGADDMRKFLDYSEAFMRPNATWRRMQVQQPPAISFAWVDRETSCNDVRLRRWNLSLKDSGGLRMGLLYDMVIQLSSQSRTHFFFRICWRFYETYQRLMIHTIFSEPTPHEFYEPRYALPLKTAIMKADLVLDTWSAEDVLFRFKSKFSLDKWTKELVQGLRYPTGDVKLNFVSDKRNLKEADEWLVDLPMGCGPGYLPDEGDDL